MMHCYDIILHTISVILIQKHKFRGNCKTFFNLLKLRSRSSRILLTCSEVTYHKRKKHFRRKVTTKKFETWKLQKIPHQYRENRSSWGVLRNSKNEGIKVFRGILSVIFENRAQGRFFQFWLLAYSNKIWEHKHGIMDNNNGQIIQTKAHLVNWSQFQIV